MVVRISLALVLLIAAGLKTHQLLAMEEDSPDSAYLFDLTNWLVIELEALFAIWLIAGWNGALLRIATITLFSLFSLYSFKLYLSGDVSCGCFGVVRVPPLQMFVIDTLAVVLAIVSTESFCPSDKPFIYEEKA